MKYSFREVRENALIAFALSCLFAAMVTLSSFVLCWQCGLTGEAASRLHQTNIIQWGTMLWLIFQYCFWSSSFISVLIHGWFWKISDVVASNISFVLPFAAAYFLVLYFR